MKTLIFNNLRRFEIIKKYIEDSCTKLQVNHFLEFLSQKMIGSIQKPENIKRKAQANFIHLKLLIKTIKNFERLMRKQNVLVTKDYRMTFKHSTYIQFNKLEKKV